MADLLLFPSALNYISFHFEKTTHLVNYCIKNQGFYNLLPCLEILLYNNMCESYFIVLLLWCYQTDPLFSEGAVYIGQLNGYVMYTNSILELSLRKCAWCVNYNKGLSYEATKYWLFREIYSRI